MRALALVLSTFCFGSIAHAELAPPEEVAEFERDHHRAESQELHILEAVAAEGALSLAGGIALAVNSSHDGGYRAAGGVDLAFGFINVALTSAVIPLTLFMRKKFDSEHEQRATVLGLDAARRKDSTFARRQSALYAINIGLDAGYVFAGAASIVASQEGVHHPNRWLGAGITLCAQSLFAAAVDLSSLIISNRRQSKIVETLTGHF